MIHTHGPWFVDEHGRTVLLRGVNLVGQQQSADRDADARARGFLRSP